MNTLKQSAKIILQKVKIPLHYKEITRLALEEGLFETTGKTPEASINAQITTDIKYKWESSDFIKTGPSTYAINPDKKEESIKIQEKEGKVEKKEEEKEKIETGFVGKAGEHSVCSELLFRWFNASIMSVDVWMDIVATKDNNLISIQVKTSNLNKFNTYVFDVRKVSFDRHSSNNVYYIFVLHGEEKDNFLILPYSEMEKKIIEKALLSVSNNERYRVNIRVREDKIYLGNKNHEVSYYLNNWGIIK